MLGFVVVAPALAIGVVALFCLILALGYVLYLRPIFDWLTRSDGGFFKRVALWPVRRASRAIDRFAQRHVASLMRAYLGGSEPIARVLDQLTVGVQRTVGTIADMAEQTHEALWTLRHVTVPRLITTALVPIRAQLQRHTGRLDALEDLNRRVAAALGDTLRALPWGVPGGYVTNFETFLGRFVQLWEHYWQTTRAQLNTLLQETIPDLRRDVGELARRLDVQIDARFDALAGRIADLERQAANLILPRLDALQSAVDLLSDQVFGPIEGGLTALLARVAELERVVTETIPQRFGELTAELEALRVDLEEGIRTGIAGLTDRLEALELEVFTAIPQRLAAMQTAIDTLAAEVFEEVGAGLSALTQRLIELETYVFGELRTQVELAIGRIETIEQTITGTILPRLRAIEELLTPAALGVAVLAALRIAAPNLFCRNVTDVTSRLCADDEAFWRDLLAGAVVFAIALNPREVAAAGQALTGALSGVIAQTVDN